MRAAARPVVRYHGGKWRLAPWVISHFPEHRVYVEPFGGGGSVLIQKRLSMVEVLNDRYSRIVNLFRVLRDPVMAERLQDLLCLTPYAEEEYFACREVSPDAVEDARRMIVLGHQGHGSTGASGGKKSGWRRGVRDHGGSSASEWRDLWQHVDLWSERLRGVYLENSDAVEVMQRWDAVDALHYVDPPYVGESRTEGLRGYAHEMEDADHVRLAECLHGLKGRVIVSGYQSDLYEELFKGWIRVERKHIADRALTRTEVLWMRNVALNAPELF